MEKGRKVIKKPIEPEKIVKIMQYLPILVASIFFVKNVMNGDMTAIIVIGVCLALFSGAAIMLKVRKVDLYGREMVLSIALPLLVFMISLFSGASYSDDFPLFLAVLGISGMFLEPKFTRIQVVMIDILLVVMYFAHPEKAGETSQYIMCYVVFNVAAWLYYMVISRGSAFIEMSQDRAKQSEELLLSIRAMGDELQQDFDVSSEKIKNSAKSLHQGSIIITSEADEATASCMEVHNKIKEAGENISQLNEQVMNFEGSLVENNGNIDTMNVHMKSVGETIDESNEVLMAMQAQMNEIAGITKEINEISYNLTILALNASVEARRAGKAGAGFGVVAKSVRDLAEQSDMFSKQVSEVVEQLLKRVAATTEKIEGSKEAMRTSEKTMGELHGSFGRLIEQFENLYENIEQQNANINAIDTIFEELNVRVADMQGSSEKNQKAAQDIVEALNIYSDNITGVIENTRKV